MSKIPETGWDSVTFPHIRKQCDSISREEILSGPSSIELIKEVLQLIADKINEHTK